MARSPDRRTAAAGPPGPAPGDGGQRSSTNLPAPYESPWGLLQRDLIAVLATLRLRIQELWRRNGEGDLSVPGFWPQALASLFWPLLLALGLGIVVALPRPLIPANPGAPSRPESQPQLQLQSQPRSHQPSRLLPSPASSSGQSPAPAEPAVAAPRTSAAADAGRAALQSQAPAAADQPAELPQPLLQLDPLLALLANDDPEHLIRSAHPDPAEARLELQLDQGFGALPESRQRQLAQLWLERCEALGYEQLHLLGGSGELLGRRARVGSGMILFSANREF